ncbi:MAG: GNAT family N-acetyltransferase [Terriglobia bacterium]
MCVYEIDPLRDRRWEAFVERHPHSSVFHSPRWLRALQRAYGYEPVVISTCTPRQDLTNGLAFCRVKSWLTGRRFVSLPFSDHCEPLVDKTEDLILLMTHLRRKVEQGKWKYIEIRPRYLSFSDHAFLPQQEDFLFHSLSLKAGAETLFLSFHKSSVQRKIRRAEREALRYEDGASERLLNEFYKLQVATRKRQYLPPQPLCWFRALVASFGEELRIRMVSSAHKPIAAMLTLSHKKCVTYKYGCRDVGCSNLGGTQLLFWKTIQESIRDGFEELDLGRSDPRHQGLVDFKERWGAQRSGLTYWRFPIVKHNHGISRATRLREQIVPLASDFSLVAIGSLLYRHLG